MKIGSHVSNNGTKMLEGSINEALSYGSTCFMVYMGAPQNTARKSIDTFHAEELRKIAQDANISLEDIIVHAPYIVNLAQTDEQKHQFAVSFLTQELRLVRGCGLKYMVIHPGAHVGAGFETGINQIIKGLIQILDNTSNDETVILIETMAGKGTECGKTFEEVKAILDGVNSERVKVCLDTCHIFDGGYDIVNHYEEVIEKLDHTIGIENIKAIHLNDSKNVLGSHKDRHENFGLGNIGFDTLMKVANDERFVNVPKILETPYILMDDKKTAFPPYREEIEMIKANKFNENLVSDIIQNHQK